MLPSVADVALQWLLSWSHILGAEHTGMVLHDAVVSRGSCLLARTAGDDMTSVSKSASYIAA